MLAQENHQAGDRFKNPPLRAFPAGDGIGAHAELFRQLDLRNSELSPLPSESRASHV
jgi:hypothetical protein